MGVNVANGGDSNATSVAETAMSLILASARNLVQGIQKVTNLISLVLIIVIHSNTKTLVWYHL